ncbi:hypothetical protein BB560_006988 [Smittium megazygosporum]|uniref:[acyl-carrier-protein] S-malonyltransferase n=1 Tax=Smittium megazygosporum TaxID=133381 RepID=A0A2T9XZN1_9FUNG|nr:hypothetical protein BB560_006988 [Smittium megazygosporum]
MNLIHKRCFSRLHSQNIIRAIAFPGQGSQFVGMGKELAENFSSARETFERTDEALGYKLSDLIFNGNYNELSNTDIAQPAIVSVGVAAVRALQQETGQEIKDLCSFILGHSIGEYTALVCANSISLEEGVRLVQLRGQEMKKAIKGLDVQMVAIITRSTKLSEISSEVENINALISENSNETNGIFSKSDSVEVATDTQFTLSGTKLAVTFALEHLEENFGDMRIFKLPISVPFHTKILKPAADELEKAFKQITFKQPDVPIVSNYTGKIIESHTEIPKLLALQTYSQVRWYDSIMHLHELYGVDRWLCPGPSSVIFNTIRKTFPKAIIRQLETKQHVLDFAEIIKKQKSVL